MRDIFYSDEAINIRNAFLGVDVIIYVEGDDDVLFWSDIFSKVAPPSRFEVEPANGAENLDEYIAKINDGTIAAIAARDSDFLKAHNKIINHPRIIYTVGYSIENSLYTTDILMRLSQSWCKSIKIGLNECEEWFSCIIDNFSDLICLDIANSLNNGGEATIGDNCTKFMKSQTSHIPCTKKIATHIEKQHR